MALAEYELLELDGFMDEELETDLLVTRPKGKHRKRVACQAAKVAGRAIAGPKGARVALKVAKRAVREAEYEAEFEDEAEFEAEFEAAGGDLELLAEMEALAEMAAEAESEAEADEFLGALASLAGPLISSFLGEAEDEYEFEDEYEYEADLFLGGLFKAATSIIPKVAPLIGRGVRMAGRFLRRPSTRRLIRNIPRTVARTAMDLRGMARRGRPITPVSTAAVLGGNLARTLGSRRAGRLRRRRFRRRLPRGIARRRRRRTVRPRYCVL